MMDGFWTAKAEETGLIVRLFCIDTKCYLRVNKNGRLFADVPQEDSSLLTDETEFLLCRVCIFSLFRVNALKGARNPGARRQASIQIESIWSLSIEGHGVPAISISPGHLF